MARAIKAVPTSALTKLTLSQVVHSQARKLLGDFGNGAKLCKVRRSVRRRAEFRLKSIASPKPEGLQLEPNLPRSHPEEYLLNKTASSLEEIQSPSQSAKFITYRHLPLDQGSSAGAIDVDSPASSSLFSSPSAVLNEGIRKVAITDPGITKVPVTSPGIRKVAVTTPASRGDKTGNTEIPAAIVKNGRLAGRKCLITGATSGIGNYLSLYIC